MKNDRYFFLTAIVILAGVLTAFLSVANPPRPGSPAHAEIQTVSLPATAAHGS